ncbi:MAG: MATE family efflux transporter [Anaerostipes sp.]|nr:MATE family efflux transporter [Anaerostipes sp.]
MKKTKNKMELLGNAPVQKALLAMGLPTMIGMMINAIYNLVDAYFVGGLGTSQMGAISVAYPLGQVIVGLGLLFGNGGASYISRLLGKGDKAKANKVASTAIYSSISVGIVMIVVALVFLNPILKLLGATESIMPYATAYAKIFITGCVFNVFNVTMNNLVTSEGAAKTTMFVLFTGAVLNIILDPILIYKFHFGVAGAALATVVSQLISTCLYLIYIGKRKSVFSFQVKECCPSKEILSEIFKIGVPTLFFQILTSLSITMINGQAKMYGDSAIAGMGAVTRVMSMGSLMVFGFIKGFQPIAGYSYGAKKYNRLNDAIKISVQWSTVFCVIFGLFMAIDSKGIIATFTTDDFKMIQIGQRSLVANGIAFFLFGFHTVYSSLFLALGKGKEGLILGICRQGICFLPVILFLPRICGIAGVQYAQPIADVITFMVTVFMAVKLKNELKEGD